jgi:hypothetical protein
MMRVIHGDEIDQANSCTRVMRTSPICQRSLIMRSVPPSRAAEKRFACVAARRSTRARAACRER